VIEEWTGCRIAIDRALTLLRFQSKFPSPNPRRILQCKEKSFQTRICFETIIQIPLRFVRNTGLPRNRRETTENMTMSVLNQCESICVSVATIVKAGGAETITTASPKQITFFFHETQQTDLAIH
jgi:hypothetical protein